MKNQSITFGIIMLLFQCFLSLAQPSIEWQKCLGGSNADQPAFLNPYKDMILQTLDSGFIIAGVSNSNDGDVTGHHGGIENDYWIVKTNKAGVIQWQKSLGGTSRDDATAIQQTADKGYIIAGSTNSNNGDVSGNHGFFDIWIIKLDSLGTIQWKKCFGGGIPNGTTSGLDMAYSIKQALDGGYIIAGKSTSVNGDATGLHAINIFYSDSWIIKLNSLGNMEWQKCLGGYKTDVANSIALDKDSGFIIVSMTGSNDGDVIGNHGAFDYWVVKLDKSGTLVWQKCYGGSKNDLPNSISNISDGGFIITGSTNSYDGDIIGKYDTLSTVGWIIKIDSIGNIQWQKLFSGDAQSAVQTKDGGFLISGNLTPNDSNEYLSRIDYYWLVKLDSSHNFQWHSADGTINGGFCVSAIQTFDGNFAFLGYVVSNGGDVSGYHGVRDIWLVKLSSINIIKNKKQEICSLCNGSIKLNLVGGIPPYTFLWSTGSTADSVSNLCHGSYKVNVVDAIGQHGFCSEVIKNDTVITYTSQTPASCWSCPNGTATIHASSGSGQYRYSWQGFSDTTITLTGLPHRWVTGCAVDSLGCIACDSVEVLSPLSRDEMNYFNNKLQLFPNPTDSKIILKVPPQFGEIKFLQLYSSIGLLYFEAENLTILDLSRYNGGIYFIIVKNDKGEKLKAIAIRE